MKRWEYKSDALSVMDEYTLNLYGKNGWELVSVLLDKSAQRLPFIVVFKREIVK